MDEGSEQRGLCDVQSKGLQKLRWYCQVCQKQCRDENGFQNHIRSESHLRNMKIVGNNPGKFIGQREDDESNVSWSWQRAVWMSRSAS